MAYIDVAELQRVLRITAPTAAETTAMQRVIDAAATEINWELGLDVDASPPLSSIIVDVNLDRAVELWRLNWSPGFGALPIGPDQIPVITARDSWYRHRLRLLPLKTSWGLG
jgi:DNA-binding transcriptional LysR family regulator